MWYKLFTSKMRHKFYGDVFLLAVQWITGRQYWLCNKSERHFWQFLDIVHKNEGHFWDPETKKIDMNEHKVTDAIDAPLHPNKQTKKIDMIKKVLNFWRFWPDLNVGMKWDSPSNSTSQMTRKHVLHDICSIFSNGDLLRWPWSWPVLSMSSLLCGTFIILSEVL